MNLSKILNHMPFQIDMKTSRTNNEPSRQDQIRGEIKEKVFKIFEEYKCEIAPVFIWIDIEGVAKEVYQDGFQGKTFFQGLCPE